MGSTYRHIRVPAPNAAEAVLITQELERRMEDPRYLDRDGMAYESDGTFLSVRNYTTVDWEPDQDRSHSEFGKVGAQVYNHQDGTFSVFGWIKD